MIPKFPDFIDLLSVNVDEYSNFTNKFEPYSDFNYTSIVSWDTSESAQVCILNNNLVLKMEDYDKSGYLLSVLGNYSMDVTIQILLDYADNNKDIKNYLKFVPEVSITPLLNKNQSLKIKDDTDNNDYVLNCLESVELPGKKYTNKRKNINKFKRNYPNIVIKKSTLADDKTLECILTLTKKWKSYNTDGAKNDEHDVDAISRICELYSTNLESLDIQCLTISVGDKTVGFCIYELLNNNWSISHFGKSDISYKGSYEYMMIEVLRDLNYQNVKWLNYEQDLGIPGLRQSKLSSQPLRYLNKYTVARI
jgi:uncharacterized protein